MMNITKIKICDVKLYISAILDGFDSTVLEISIVSYIQASICVYMFDNVIKACLDLKGAIVNSDILGQYPS